MPPWGAGGWLCSLPALTVRDPHPVGREGLVGRSQLPVMGHCQVALHFLSFSTPETPAGPAAGLTLVHEPWRSPWHV